MTLSRLTSAAALALALGSGAAVAQNAPSDGPGLTFTLRGGVASTPEYFGSDEYSAAPDLGFRFNSLQLNDGSGFGSPDPWAESLGFNVHGAFRYIGERDSSDFDELRGLDDIDDAVELGLGVGYGTDNFYAFLDARRGFGGHESWVGEAGMDLIYRPDDRWRFSAGPRLFWGSDGYADTYFGVSPSEAASSSLGAYDAEGGLLSAGVEVGARYRINDDWGVEGALTYDRYMNDAEDSPIVEAGSDDQWGVRLGLTRTFRLRF